jgi:hypothetical protein
MLIFSSPLDKYQIIFPPNDPYETKFYYQYESDKIVKTIGGFEVVPAGTFIFGNLLFSTSVHDSLVYKSDSVYIYTRPDITYSLFDNPNDPSIYVYDSSDRLLKILRRDGFEIHYSYSNNQITEKAKNGMLLRNLYFENGNLIRTEQLDYWGQETVQHKREILFQEYDNNPNPFMNKHYILGAFLRAFSLNNYREITFNEYNLVDGNMVLTTTQTTPMPVDYNNGHYPLFGDYE